MGWLAPKLEPGERLLVRSTDGGAARYWVGVFLLLGVIGWVRGVWAFEIFGPKFVTAILFLLVYALLILAVAWPWTRWKWAITDRRVLKRYGLFSSEIAEMRHETVEVVRLDGTELCLHGREYRWRFDVSRNFCRADVLSRLFGDRFGETGLPAKPVGEMLDADDTVLHRRSSLVTGLLPWAVLLSGPVLLFVEMAWPETLETWYFSPNMIVVPYMVLLHHVVAFWRRRGWRTVLTDRRLLIRRPHWPSRCDEIPLDAVTDAYWDSKGWELVVVSPGRRDTIFCLPWTARRIVAALECNDRSEALA
jgi:membrane protein YdbS with pleckstrin-like domain